MNRRKFLEQISINGLFIGASCVIGSCRGVFRTRSVDRNNQASNAPVKAEKLKKKYVNKSKHKHIYSQRNGSEELHLDIREEGDLYFDTNAESSSNLNSGHRKKDLKKLDAPASGDLYASKEELLVIRGLLRKIQKVQNYVGYGHFNILTFDDALKHMKISPRLDVFNQIELRYLEQLFYRDAKDYGFLGDKVSLKLSDAISKKEVLKIPYTGHFLYKEQNNQLYSRLKKDVGSSLILTSGVRGVIKQIHLFLAKTHSTNGNFSQASRSLAPPGYSYHAVGDFDVGKKGLGSLNFTNKFSQTDEFKKIMDLTYIDIRYPTDNPYGVRFEPWHIDGFQRRAKKCSNCG